MIFFLTPILHALWLIVLMFFASTRFLSYAHVRIRTHANTHMFTYSYYTSYSTYARSTWCFEDAVSNTCDIPSVELFAELNRMIYIS